MRDRIGVIDDIFSKIPVDQAYPNSMCKINYRIDGSLATLDRFIFQLMSDRMGFKGRGLGD